MGCRRLMHLLPLPLPVEVGKPRRTVADNPPAPITAFSGEAGASSWAMALPIYAAAASSDYLLIDMNADQRSTP